MGLLSSFEIKDFFENKLTHENVMTVFNTNIAQLNDFQLAWFKRLPKVLFKFIKQNAGFSINDIFKLLKIQIVPLGVYLILMYLLI